MTIRILLADDHEVYRSGLKAVLDTQPDLECVADVGDGQQALAETLRLRPDVAVLDVRMPRMDGLMAAEAILGADDAETKVVLLTTYDEDSYVYRALRAGASGFLLKGTPTEDLLTAVRVAARGDALIDPSVTRRLIARLATALQPAPTPVGWERLTPRERDVLVSLARGLANTEIAAQLHLGEETVKTHVSRVLAKLGLRDRTQAVIYVYQHRLVPPTDRP